MQAIVVKAQPCCLRRIVEPLVERKEGQVLELLGKHQPGSQMNRVISTQRVLLRKKARMMRQGSSNFHDLEEQPISIQFDDGLSMLIVIQVGFSPLAGEAERASA